MNASFPCMRLCVRTQMCACNVFGFGLIVEMTFQYVSSNRRTWYPVLLSLTPCDILCVLSLQIQSKGSIWSLLLISSFASDLFWWLHFIRPPFPNLGFTTRFLIDFNRNPFILFLDFRLSLIGSLFSPFLQKITLGNLNFTD